MPKAQKTDIISEQRKVEIKALALWRQPCFMAARVASEIFAGMAELADALDSGSSEGNFV